MEAKLFEYLQKAKDDFDRTVLCKHTEFDDLYPYMMEHQQFFWYKRHAAWSALLTVVKIAGDLGVEWRQIFTPEQLTMIERRVLDKRVLDEWFGIDVKDGQMTEA
ncbi:hypothetical protein [Fodinisporobacter ferrooxydans]